MKWLKEEVDLLIELYEQDLPTIEICTYFKDRSIDSVRGKLQGLHLSKNNRWTIEEDKLLVELAMTKLSSREIHEKYLPNRSSDAIQQRYNKKLKICRSNNKHKSNNKYASPIGKIREDKPAKVYLIEFEGNKYKYGCTTIEIKDRLRKSSIKNYTIVFYRQFETGIEAMKLEEIWRDNLLPYKCKDKFLPSGNSETFEFIQ